MPAQHVKASERAQEDTSPAKIDVTSKSPVGDISVVTLIRTDTTLDHSQKGREGMSIIAPPLKNLLGHVLFLPASNITNHETRNLSISGSSRASASEITKAVPAIAGLPLSSIRISGSTCDHHFLTKLV